MNSAFLFIKPHANFATVQALVSETLTSKGITIVNEGEILAEDIASKMLIDNHYYSIASKASILKPFDLNVPKDKFEEKFGVAWDAALEQGIVYNALDAMAFLEIDAEELGVNWRKIPPELLIKFGGGFYCGKLEIEGKPSIYVFNAFFMSMRAMFVEPGSSIHFYVVEWNPQTPTGVDGDGNPLPGLSWKDFRANILGATDPTTAPPDSLRGLIMAKWEELGLKAAPTVTLNGVHGSASPFEGLAEKSNWLGANLEEDEFGLRLLALNIPADTIKSWYKDPQVEGIGSVFDYLEDTNSEDTILKISEMWAKINAVEAESAEPVAE